MSTSAQSPTPTEWQVVVTSPPAQYRGRIMSMVGPGEAMAVGSSIILTGFYDDAQAKSVAKSITKHYQGAIASYGPRGKLAAEDSYEDQGFSRDAAEDRPALRWTEVAFDLKSDASKFAKMLEKRGRGVTASLDGHIVTTNATWSDIQKVLFGNEWEKSYKIAPSARKYDLAAEEAAEGCAHKHPPEVPSEPCPGDPSAMGSSGEPVHPPWLSCTGSPEVYKQWVEFGDKFGPIKNTRKLYDLLAPRMQSTDQEIFVVVVVDLHGHVRGISEVNRGERSGVGVSVTQVMRAASMIQGGTAFMVGHNHPSGKCRPSEADRELTKTIRQAAKPHGDECKFIDHVVIGQGEYFSIVENKLHKVK